SSTTRSPPRAAGCCGPKFIVKVRREASPMTLRLDSWRVAPDAYENVPAGRAFRRVPGTGPVRMELAATAPGLASETAGHAGNLMDVRTTPLIATSGRGVLDPGTGRPVDDAYFGGINRKLADKG